MTSPPAYLSYLLVVLILPVGLLLLALLKEDLKPVVQLVRFVLDLEVDFSHFGQPFSNLLRKGLDHCKRE